MLSKDQLSELDGKHGRTCHIVCGEIEVVLRAPTRAEYRRCRAATHNPSQMADAQEDLVRQIVVYPSTDDFDRLLEKFPGFCENKEVSEQIARFTGIIASDAKKA